MVEGESETRIIRNPLIFDCFLVFLTPSENGDFDKLLCQCPQKNVDSSEDIRQSHT